MLFNVERSQMLMGSHQNRKPRHAWSWVSDIWSLVSWSGLWWYGTGAARLFYLTVGLFLILKGLDHKNVTEETCYADVCP